MSNILESDRELDRHIAASFFGWRWLHPLDRYGNPQGWWAEAYLRQANDTILPIYSEHRVTARAELKAAFCPPGEEWFPAYENEKSAKEKALPRFSTNIAASWKLVDHLESLGWRLVLMRLMPPCEYEWSAHFFSDDGNAVSAESSTPMLAICYAALNMGTSQERKMW